MTMIVRAVELNENIVRLRKASGLSQYEVVAEMQLLGSSISRSAYAKIECGERNIKATDFCKTECSGERDAIYCKRKPEEYLWPSFQRRKPKKNIENIRR